MPPLSLPAGPVTGPGRLRSLSLRRARLRLSPEFLHRNGPLRLRVYRGGCSFGTDAGLRPNRILPILCAQGSVPAGGLARGKIYDGMQQDSDIAPPRFFGYGSLVNRATHGYAPAEPALLQGWRRVWVHVSARPVAYLSVEPAPGMTISGLVAPVPGGDWAALDAREYAYLRHPVMVQAAQGRSAAQVYAVPTDHAAPPSLHNPILLSYLDAVVQGFLREFGPEGVEDFFATTAGWQAPIEDDRAAPRYPRAQALGDAERALVDRMLRAHRPGG